MGKKVDIRIAYFFTMKGEKISRMTEHASTPFCRPSKANWDSSISASGPRGLRI